MGVERPSVSESVGLACKAASKSRLMCDLDAATLGKMLSFENAPLQYCISVLRVEFL